MDQVQVAAVVVALRDQFLFHVGDDVVFLGVDGHDAPVLGHLLKHGPQVAGGYLGEEGGEHFEAGQSRLDSLANLADRLRGNCPGQDVVEGEIDIRVACEGLAAFLDLGHDWVSRRHSAWIQRQVAGKVDVGGDAAEGRGTAGGFRWLGEHLALAAGPIVGHRNIDVGVGLDTARKHDLAGRVEGPNTGCIEGPWRGHRDDLFALDAHIHH